MSKFWIIQQKTASYEDIPFTTDKDTNLEAIRTRFLKYGSPSGTMKIQILNNAKDTVIAESNSLNCNYSTESEYEGTDDTVNISWIRFDFEREAIRTGNTYYFRLIPDTTYFSNVETEEYLETWTLDVGYYKATPSKTPTLVYRNATQMTSVGSKGAIDSETKYYWDGTYIWLNYNPYPDYSIYTFSATTNYIALIIDYPKPTNDNGTTSIEDTEGRNFNVYPRGVIQMFGRDYG